MSGYWRSVGLVLTGTGTAQIIPVLGTLVLARQYAPAEFGIFAAWLGIVMLMSVVLTGRYETALAIEPDGESRQYAVLATLTVTVLASCAVAVLLAVTIFIIPKAIVDIPTTLVIALVPTALANALAIIWQSWAAADGRYLHLSLMRIGQAASITIIQITAGVMQPSAASLGVGHFTGLLLGIFLSIFMMPLGKFSIAPASQAILGFWRKHSNCPRFGMPAGTINTAAAQLPLLIVASRFGAEVAGLLAMTMRILGAPIGLLGKSVLDVFKRHAATSFRERGECASDYIRTFRVLAIGSFAFCVVMVFASEWLFAFAFGEVWRGAGTITIWLLPLFALRFIASPLSYMVYIAGKQHIDLLWQIVLLGVVLATLSIPNNHALALQAYSGGYSILYVIYIWMSYRFSRGG